MNAVHASLPTAPIQATSTFQAPACLNKIVQLVKRLFGAIINPFVRFDNWIRKQISFLVLPASRMSHSTVAIESLRLRDLERQPTAANVYSEVQLEVEESTYLKGFEIRHPPSKNWIVYFLPNAGSQKSCRYLLQDFACLSNCNVLCYDYRGVGGSDGETLSETTLITDGVKIVQSLLDQGIAPENILLHGRSIGGGVATCVRKQLSDLGKKVHLCNERSFTSLQAVVSELGSVIGQNIANNIGKKINLRNERVFTCLKASVSGLVRVISYIAGWILRAYDWRLDAAEAMRNSEGLSKPIVMAAKKYDLIVRERAQFHNAPGIEAACHFRELIPEDPRADDGHVSPWNIRDWCWYINAVSGLFARV